MPNVLFKEMADISITISTAPLLVGCFNVFKYAFAIDLIGLIYE